MAIEKKKSKPWEPFWSYQLNSTADLANFEVNGLDWQCCFAGSSKMAPRVFIFSIVLVAEYLSYLKSIETHVHAFLSLNISAVGILKRKRLSWLCPSFGFCDMY